MKTKKSIFTKINLLGLLVFALFAVNNSQAQTTGKTISGVISDSFGPMEDVNIILQGTKTGTTTNKNGEFTFPKNLQVGDILIISYLGYEKQLVEITNNTQKLNLKLNDEMIEVAGALNSNQPYKSSRKK